MPQRGLFCDCSLQVFAVDPKQGPGTLEVYGWDRQAVHGRELAWVLAQILGDGLRHAGLMLAAGCMYVRLD